MATAPPTISALPTPPDPNDRSTFNARAYPWSVAQQTLATQANAVAANVYANAQAAETGASTASTKAGEASTSASNAATSASTATTKAGEASNSASSAETSRIAASKLNLGPKAVAPVVDNQGAALLTGATYYDTALGRWRVWSGAVWGDGVSVGSGVVAAQINAATAKSTPADADELGITDSAASWGLKKLTFANLKAWIGSLFVSKSGDTMTGPLVQAAGTAALPSYTFSGSTSTGFYSPSAGLLGVTTNGVECIRVTGAGAVAIGHSNPTAKFDVSGSAWFRGAPSAGAVLTIFPDPAAGSTGVVLAASFVTGGYGPFRFFTSNAERLRIEASGNVLVTGSGVLGYGVGSGGTATVSGGAAALNKPSGVITLALSSLAVGGYVSFTLTNSSITAQDVVAVSVSGGTLGPYRATADKASAGSCVITIQNSSASVSSDTILVNFAVFKVATS